MIAHPQTWYLFIFYLPVVSAAQRIRNQMIGRIVNKELEGIGMEEVLS
jgi:hypothetical protein